METQTGREYFSLKLFQSNWNILCSKLIRVCSRSNQRRSIQNRQGDSRRCHWGKSMASNFAARKGIDLPSTKSNQSNVTLLIKASLRKVYHPCILFSKKRYAGYKYESPDQTEPIFEAKGIETIRRDTCPAVSKILEKSLRHVFLFMCTSPSNSTTVY